MSSKTTVSMCQQFDVSKKMLTCSKFAKPQTFNSSYHKNNGVKEPFRMFCEDCAVMLTSELQAQEHFLGKKHQNIMKIKINGINMCSDAKMILNNQYSPIKRDLFFPDESERRYHSNYSLLNYGFRGFKHENFDDVIPPPTGTDSILETVIKNEKTFSMSDLSIYRTPSGKYYCQPCNLTVNSTAQFLQHTESRKHKRTESKFSYKVK